MTNINPIIVGLFDEARRNGVAKATLSRVLFANVCREFGKINYKKEPEFNVQLMCDKEVHIFIMKY